MQQKQTSAQTTTTEQTATPLLDKILDNQVTYTPFMGKDDITLTPRMILKYFAQPTRQGYTATVEQAAKFVKLCQTRGLNPWEGDAFIVGFDSNDGPQFNLITAHQAFLKRAEVHPDFDGMTSGVTVKDKVTGELIDQEGDYVDDGQTLVGGWAKVFLKRKSIPTYRRLKLSTFSTGRSRWVKDPAGMICKCAEADALRSSFPTSLGGMYLREEVEVNDETPRRAAVQMPKSIDEMATGGWAPPANQVVMPQSIDEPAEPQIEESPEPPPEPVAEEETEQDTRRKLADTVCKLMSEAGDKDTLKAAWSLLPKGWTGGKHKNDEHTKRVNAVKEECKARLELAAVRDEIDDVLGQFDAQTQNEIAESVGITDMDQVNTLEKANKLLAAAKNHAKD